MEQLARLKARIESLEELRELMRAMRALAAAHVQSAQASISGIRAYTTVIENAIAEGVTLLSQPPGRSPGTDDGRVLVVIGAEHGFVGALNEQLVEQAGRTLGSDRQLALVGTRLAEVTREHGLAASWTEAMSTQTAGVLKTARRVAARLAEAAEAELLFAAYRRGGGHEIECRRVLPLAGTLLEQMVERPPPLHHLPARVLLERLAGEYLLAEVTHAIMEAFASENGARLQVMEAADRNIDNRLNGLEVHARSARQTAITAELLDVITGGQAVTEG